MWMKPDIESYGESKSSYGDTIKIICDGVAIYYSRTVVVAFRVKGDLFVRTNDWGQSTGRHLNLIDGGTFDAHNARLTEDEFNAAWTKHIRHKMITDGLEATEMLLSLTPSDLDTIEKLKLTTNAELAS